MRWTVAAVGCLSLLLFTVSSRAAGPSPARLSPETRDRFAAALSAYRAGDWAQAARELGEISRAAAPIVEYALLHQAESLARLGDAAAARAAAQQAIDMAPDSRVVPPALLLGPSPWRPRDVPPRRRRPSAISGSRLRRRRRPIRRRASCAPSRGAASPPSRSGRYCASSAQSGLPRPVSATRRARRPRRCSPKGRPRSWR